jgi:hypothetical protein
MVLIISVWQLLFISSDLPVSSDIDSTFFFGGGEGGGQRKKRIRVQQLREIVFVFYTYLHVGTTATRLVLQSDYGLEDREVRVPLLVQITRYVASPQHSHWLWVLPTVLSSGYQNSFLADTAAGPVR